MSSPIANLRERQREREGEMGLKTKQWFELSQVVTEYWRR